MTLRSLNLPVRMLFTCFLLTIGVGYLLAILYLFLIDLEPHAKKGMGMIQAVIMKYYGQRGTTTLEAALNGAMGENIAPAPKKQLVEWIRNGATETGFPLVQPIFIDYCAGCHSTQSGLSISSLTTYEEVTAYIQMDMGESIKKLAKVSHIHLFGMSFIFILTGGIFVLSAINIWWRALLVAVPFVAIWIDIGSWWIMKVEPLFAYTVIVGGSLMGLSLSLQILISLYEMWFKKSRAVEAGLNTGL